MKKTGLNLDFESIRKRIESDKKLYKPGVWADMVGVSVNVVSNVHGKTKQRPSLEYIVAVSLATGKSVDYYLWGSDPGQNSRTGQPDNVIKVITEDQDLVGRFKNPEKAAEINEDLLELEAVDESGFDEVHKIIKMKLEIKGASKKNRDASSGKRRAGE